MTTRDPIDWPAVRARVAALASPPEPDPRAVLAQRARHLARPIDAGPRPEEHLELVTFSIAGERHGLELPYVTGIVRLEALARVPRMPAHVFGVTAVRGDVVPVFDLYPFVGGRRGPLDDRSRLVVLGPKSDMAIVVDAVHDVVSVRRDGVHRPPPTDVPWIRGVTDDALVVLDGATLIADPRFVVEHRPLEP